MVRPGGSTSLHAALEQARPGEPGARRRAVLSHALPGFNACGIEA